VPGEGRDDARVAAAGLRRRTGLRAAAAAAAGLASAAAGCDSPPKRGAEPAPSTAGPTSVQPSPAASSTPTLPDEVVHGPRDRPAVALTFHGQGDAAGISRLLTELEGAQARVTVLAVGTWLQGEPAMARRVLDGGHELGNHTQRHLAINTMDAAQAFEEIDACARTLRRLTGSIGTWFRPSQTQHATPAVRAQATRVGYRTTLSYDVDSLDNTDPGATAIARTTLAAVTNGSIVSLHFGHAGTIGAIPLILDGLHQRGLRPVTMTELMS
jgi:peptidoglycan/xylan/chitin deacetylase (PgdA/CDA1 family)